MTNDAPGPVPEHIAVYQRLRRLFGNPELRSTDGRRRRRAADAAVSEPYGLGRDPRGVGDVLAGVAAARGRESPLARAELLANWPEIVGGPAVHTPTGLIVTVDTSPGHEANVERLHRDVEL